MDIGKFLDDYDDLNDLDNDFLDEEEINENFSGENDCETAPWDDFGTLAL